MKILFIILAGFLISCSSAPKLNPEKIRPWSQELETEYPQEKSVLVRYKRGPFELTYLAARHSNEMESDTLHLVHELFRDPSFSALIIESIPYSSGESPVWFIEDAKNGVKENFIASGESGLAALLAYQNQIPFFGGEPDHKEIYQGLKAKGFSDQDILGFVLVRQVPQWVREREPKEGLIDRRGPKLLSYYCHAFEISKCLSIVDLKKWYRTQMEHELTADVTNEEVTPLENGRFLTQKISAEVGHIRDRYTLSVIEKMLAKYEKVAVVYGAGHLITLRQSFDEDFGPPQYQEDK